MNMLLREARYAFRQLRRAPGYTLTAVLTLALGIGSSSAIFCLMDGLWLHPIRVQHPGQLVRVFSTTGQDPDGAFSYPEVQAYSARMGALKNTMALGRRGSIMQRADGTSALLLTNVVSSNFFADLGIQPMIGRAFSAQDAQTLRIHPGVLLGYGFWRREFNGDTHIIGRQISLLRGRDHRSQVDVWGVLPPSFREVDNGMDRDLWMPVETWANVAQSDDLTSRQFRWFNILGRLASGSTVAQADEQASVIARSLEQDDPVNNRGRGARALSDFRYRMGNAGTSGLVLFVIVGCVVLLATVNVAQLLLARGLARRSEVSLRLSLGARPLTVARQLLIEKTIMGALSLMAGLGCAAAISAVLPRLLVSEPAMLSSIGSSQTAFQLDWRVVIFAGSLAVITMLLLALVPLAQFARPELLPVLQNGSVNPTAARSSIGRRIAIWLQIAISFALLISMGTLVRSFINTRTQSIGLTRNQVLLAWTQEPDAVMRDRVVARMRALPGVEAVSYAIRSPLSLSEGGIAVKALLPSHPELRDPVEIKFNAVGPGFLEMMGTHIVRGRGFTEADDQDRPLTVIINQSMAQKYWPDQNPIGQVVELEGSSPNANARNEARIIGVAENAPINQIGEIVEPYLYVPFAQYLSHLSNMGEITFALATGPNAMSLAQAVRQVFIHTDPLLDPMMMTSLSELIRYSAGTYQMMAELVSALGLIGLALTVVGLYGFLTFGVAQRRREIGIRMALGASREATAWLVLRETGRLAAVGLGLGIVLALAAVRLETSMLFGVGPLDAPSLIYALSILVAAVAMAAWLPARRAASVEPMQALRAE